MILSRSIISPPSSNRVKRPVIKQLLLVQSKGLLDLVYRGLYTESIVPRLSLLQCIHSVQECVN